MTERKGSDEKSGFEPPVSQVETNGHKEEGSLPLHAPDDPEISTLTITAEQIKQWYKRGLLSEKERDNLRAVSEAKNN